MRFYSNLHVGTRNKNWVQNDWSCCTDCSCRLVVQNVPHKNCICIQDLISLLIKLIRTFASNSSVLQVIWYYVEGHCIIYQKSLHYCIAHYLGMQEHSRVAIKGEHNIWIKEVENEVGFFIGFPIRSHPGVEFVVFDRMIAPVSSLPPTPTGMDTLATPVLNWKLECVRIPLHALHAPISSGALLFLSVRFLFAY